MPMLVRSYDAEQTLLERDAEERRRRGVTFRELAGEYLEHVKGGKPIDAARPPAPRASA